jgi:hypothetical protein
LHSGFLQTEPRDAALVFIYCLLGYPKSVSWSVEGNTMICHPGITEEAFRNSVKSHTHFEIKPLRKGDQTHNRINLSYLVSGGNWSLMDNFQKIKTIGNQLDEALRLE